MDVIIMSSLEIRTKMTDEQIELVKENIAADVLGYNVEVSDIGEHSRLIEFKVEGVDISPDYEEFDDLVKSLKKMDLDFTISVTAYELIEDGGYMYDTNDVE